MPAQRARADGGKVPEDLLVAIGAVLVAAAIVGGAVEGAGVMVPVIAGTGRQVVAGLVGLLMLAVGLSSRWLQVLRAGRLAAGLEAQARLETAVAIREVSRELEHDHGVEVGPPPELPPTEPKPTESPEPVPVLPQSEGTVTGRTAPQTAGIAGAVDGFYSDARLESKVWFLASLLAAFVGLAVIVWAVIVVIVWEVLRAGSQPASDASLKVVLAALAEAIAVLFYRQSNASRKHAAELLSSTQGDRHAETARQILSTIQDDGRA